MKRRHLFPSHREGGGGGKALEIATKDTQTILSRYSGEKKGLREKMFFKKTFFDNEMKNEHVRTQNAAG